MDKLRDWYESLMDRFIDGFNNWARIRILIMILMFVALVIMLGMWALWILATGL